MAANKELGIADLGVLNKRSDACLCQFVLVESTRKTLVTRPGRQDVVTGEGRLGLEQLVDLLQDKENIVLAGHRLPLHRTGIVRRSSNSHALIRQNKNDTAVRGSGINYAHTLRAQLSGQYDMSTRRRGKDGLSVGVVHTLDGVGEGSELLTQSACGLNGNPPAVKPTAT